jgi:rare lipoprotein A
MLVKTALIAHSLAGALAANTGPVPLQTALPDQMSHPPERVLEVGEATWYHRQRAPNITASGERFNPMGMTAAHRSIPLGTIVRVTDESTGRFVVVRVNDREPPHGRRCIDLAEGAALALGIRSEGWAHVKISEVGTFAGPDAEPTEVAELPDAAVSPSNAPAARRKPLPHRQSRAHTRH